MAIACLLILSGCITFKINSLSSPEEVVFEMELCSKIEDAGELLEPLEIASEFPQDGRNIYCFISLMEVSREVRMKWKWYSPDKSLYRESEEVIVNSEGVYLEEITAYDKITPDIEKKWQGRWRVAVLIDGQFKVGKSFWIK